jgi:hypothetical protein
MVLDELTILYHLKGITLTVQTGERKATMSSTLKEGAAAPQFTLPADGSKTVTLSALLGKAVVLYFYPKDDTSGCTLEAQAFNTLRPAFEKAAASSASRPIRLPAMTSSRRNTDLALPLPPMKPKRRLKLMASGLKKACMAASIWALNAPQS